MKSKTNGLNQQQIRIPIDVLTFTSFPRICFWGGLAFFLFFTSLSLNKGYASDRLFILFIKIFLGAFVMYFLISKVGNTFFNQYLLITPDEIIHVGSKIHWNPEKKFERRKMKSLLWECKKIVTYGYASHLYLIDMESNRFELIERQRVFWLSKTWFRFLDQLAASSGLPVDQKILVSTQGEGGGQEMEETSIALAYYEKCHRLYKNYLVGLALTILLFSMTSTFYFSEYSIAVGFVCVIFCLCYTFFLYAGLKKLGEIKDRFQTIVTILTLIVPFILIYIQVTVFFKFIIGN